MQKIGIIGCGTMGAQLALTLQSRNIGIILKVKTEKHVDEGRASIMKLLSNAFWVRYLGRRMGNTEVNDLAFTTNIQDMEDRDLILDATSEQYDVKFRVIEEINQIAGAGLTVATNTSGLSVTRLSEKYKFPSRLCGLHFFNPLHSVKLVEITGTHIIDHDVMDKLKNFVRSLGMHSMVIDSQPGLFVNRLIAPFWLDVVRELQNSAFTPNEIDMAIKLGCNHPMGPLELLDNIGLDVFLNYCNNVHYETNDNRYQAPPLLVDMVSAHQLGTKTNQGFYRWRNGKKYLD